MLERARANPKIRFVCNAQILRWNGDGNKGMLSGLTYKDATTGEEHEVE